MPPICAAFARKLSREAQPSDPNLSEQKSITIANSNDSKRAQLLRDPPGKADMFVTSVEALPEGNFEINEST